VSAFATARLARRECAPATKASVTPRGRHTEWSRITLGAKSAYLARSQPGWQRGATETSEASSGAGCRPSMSVKPEVGHGESQYM